MLTLYDSELSAQYGQTESVVFCQLKYWLERATTFVDGRAWVYKSAREMAAELGLSEQRVRRALARLCESGLLQRAKLAAQRCRQVYYYCLPNAQNPVTEPDKSKLSKQPNRSYQFEQIDPINLITSNTEITDPKITSKNHSHSLTADPEILAGSERERDDFVKSEEKDQECPTEVIAVPAAATEEPLEKPRVDPEGGCSGLPPEKEKSFKSWLIRLATRLDKRDPVSWAVAVARRPDPVIVEQFEQQAAATTPPPLPPSPPLPPPPGAAAQADGGPLARLQAKWSMPVPWVAKLRREVAEEVAANPEWGIVCDAGGPLLLEF